MTSISRWTLALAAGLLTVAAAAAPVTVRVDILTRPTACAEEDNVSLTLTALNSCHEMLFEATGAGKRAILTRVFAGEDLPARRAHAIGETIWLLDKAALPENISE